MTRRPPADLNVVAAFYKRWAPHEDKRREIADDHKEMFAEAKANGLNPKALRKAFAEQYRVENQTNDQAEKRAANDADFELYLTALARVREDVEEFDPETGEIKPVGNGAGGAEEETQVATVRASSSANSSQSVETGPAPTAVDVSQAPSAGTGGDEDRQLTPDIGSDADEQVSGVDPCMGVDVAPHSEPAEGNTPTSAGHGDRGAVVPSAAPVVADRTKPNPICQDPEDCGVEASWNHVCGSCLRRRAQTEAARAVQ